MKVAALETQLTNACAEAREKINDRIARVQAEYETRSAKSFGRVELSLRWLVETGVLTGRKAA